MKILLLNWRDIWHPKSGGAEIVTMQHAKGWAERGHTVTWLTSWYNNAKKEETVEQVTFKRMSGSLFIYVAGFLYVLRNGYRYDVIVDEIHALPFFTPLATRRPKVAFIHEIAGNIWDYMAPFPLNYIGKILEHIYFYFYKRTHFWTDSASTIQELASFGISPNQCTAIPCPIKTEKKYPLQKKEKNPTFIFVSRVVAMKGIEDVIRAFAIIRKSLPDAELAIVGSGDEKYIDRLLDLVHTLHIDTYVHFFGKVSEKEKFSLLSSSHLLLHASVKEGWGLVVLEAASVLTPSVVYNVPGLRDVVKDKKTGIIVHSNTPQALADAVVKLYYDTTLYKNLQKNGAAWVNSLKWEDVIDQSEQVLQNAIDENGEERYTT